MFRVEENAEVLNQIDALDDCVILWRSDRSLGGSASERHAKLVGLLSAAGAGEIDLSGGVEGRKLAGILRGYYQERRAGQLAARR